jgi:hypothetical protein
MDKDKESVDVVGRLIVAELHNSILDGYQMSFSNAKMLLQGIIASASRNEDGAYYDWDALKAQLNDMNIASKRYWSEV